MEKQPKSFLYLVIFEKDETKALEISKKNTSAISKTPDVSESAEVMEIITALKDELQMKDQYLLSTNDELERTNEDLKSANEEMQSINEELQSMNEELETSKEELQSVNEELATVNGELEVKVDDLSQINNEMNNLLAGTEIASIFLDHDLKILSYTPVATEIINLIKSDIGRPIGNIALNLKDYHDLEKDAQRVLDTLIPIEIRVQTVDGSYYTMRILPYRTQENVIEGIVINFMDITKLIQTLEALQTASQGLRRLAVVVNDANDAITVQDLAGHTLAWNPAAEKMYGWDVEEALTMNVRDRIPPEKIDEELENIYQLSQEKIMKPYYTKRIRKDRMVINIWLTATALVNAEGNVYGIATTERERKETE